MEFTFWNKDGEKIRIFAKHLEIKILQNVGNLTEFFRISQNILDFNNMI